MTEPQTDPGNWHEPEVSDHEEPHPDNESVAEEDQHEEWAYEEEQES